LQWHWILKCLMSNSLAMIPQLLVTLTGWYCTKHPKPCCHFLSIMLPHLCSNTPDSSTSAL
jgi:hypothetical protein